MMSDINIHHFRYLKYCRIQPFWPAVFTLWRQKAWNSTRSTSPGIPASCKEDPSNKARSKSSSSCVRWSTKPKVGNELLSTWPLKTAQKKKRGGISCFKFYQLPTFLNHVGFKPACVFFSGLNIVFLVDTRCKTAVSINFIAPRLSTPWNLQISTFFVWKCRVLWMFQIKQVGEFHSTNPSHNVWLSISSLEKKNKWNYTPEI